MFWEHSCYALKDVYKQCIVKGNFNPSTKCWFGAIVYDTEVNHCSTDRNDVKLQILADKAETNY